jgi:NTE family protein
MRAIEFVTRLIEGQHLQGFKRMLIHSIAADDVMSGLGVASKLNAEWGFLTHMRDTGRRHAEAWLESAFEHLGQRSTVDIAEKFL